MSEANIQRFSSGVAITMGARLLMTGNSVVAGVLVARLLGAETLGIYLVLASAIQMLLQVSGFALHLTNTHFTAREPEKMIPMSVNSVVFALLSGGGCSAIVWLLSPMIMPGVPSELALIGLAVVPFQLITTYLLNLLLAHGEVKTFNLLDVIGQSFVLVNAAAALLIFGGGLVVLVSLNSIAGVLMSAVSGFIFYKYVSRRFSKSRWRGDLSLISPMLTYSLKGFIFWASTFLVYRIDLMIVNYFNGSTEAAVYAVATQCSLFLLLLPNGISLLLRARVSATQDAGGEFTSQVARHTSLLLAIGCILSVPGGFVVSAVYGSGFEGLPIQLFILLPGVFCVGVQLILAQYFVGTGMPLFLSLVWLVTLSSNVLINLVVVPLYGAIGAAGVSSICYFAVSCAVYWYFRRQTGLSILAVLVPAKEEIKRLPQLFRS
ncbi:MAG: polysaccharide biosynthesis C-terminal domain-containing protein [Pyrinomonadaceae bacterium]